MKNKEVQVKNILYKKQHFALQAKDKYSYLKNELNTFITTVNAKALKSLQFCKS